jgi:hypothetical protein
MRAGAIHLAKHLIGDRTRLVRKRYVEFGHHREASEGVSPAVTINCFALTLR